MYDKDTIACEQQGACTFVRVMFHGHFSVCLLNFVVASAWLKAQGRVQGLVVNILLATPPHATHTMGHPAWEAIEATPAEEHFAV